MHQGIKFEYFSDVKSRFWFVGLSRNFVEALEVSRLEQK
jgi:hypothetical protein